MASTSDIELRSGVKFCVTLNKSLTERLKMIKSTGKYDKCSPALVCKWHSRFRCRRESISDDLRSARPAVVVCSIRDSVTDMVYKNRTTVRVLADEHGVSSSTVHKVLTDKLKVSVRWVPRLLMDTERERQVHCSWMFLSHFDA